MTVEIRDFTPGKGQFILAVFNTPATFDEQEQPVYYQTVAVKNGDKQATATKGNSAEKIVFTSIEPGSYAIAVFQDINMNGKLDKNFLGVPSEPYGFSGGKTHRWKPPSFEEAGFRVSPGASHNERIALLEW